MTEWRYGFSGIITAIFPRSLVRSMRKVGDDIITERDPPLWHIQVGDISFQVGAEQPPAQVGDRVSITVAKVEDKA